MATGLQLGGEGEVIGKDGNTGVTAGQVEERDKCLGQVRNAGACQVCKVP